MSDFLSFKWGTLKSWSIDEKYVPILQRWHDLGVSMSAIAQHNSPAQREILCELIDAVEDDVEIRNDWSGKIMTKEEAKKYVMEYER